MKLVTSIAALVVLGAAAGASAQVYTETFDDPFGEWTKRWFYQNSNAENYYVATGDCNIDNRGNNECGLWITDEQGCGVGVGGPTVTIKFSNGFGDNLTSIKFEILCFVMSDVIVFDKDGNKLAVFQGINNGNFPTCGGEVISATSNTGIGGFIIDSTAYDGGQIEGNTAFDTITVEAGEESCYADCDGSGELDVDDFICFQTAFGTGDKYADCDGSGELDIDDFICYQTAYGLGCGG